LKYSAAGYYALNQICTAVLKVTESRISYNPEKTAKAAKTKRVASQCQVVSGQNSVARILPGTLTPGNPTGVSFNSLIDMSGLNPTYKRSLFKIGRFWTETR
jgi:hypothetical protein